PKSAARRRSSRHRSAPPPENILQSERERDPARGRCLPHRTSLRSSSRASALFVETHAAPACLDAGAAALFLEPARLGGLRKTPFLTLGSFRLMPQPRRLVAQPPFEPLGEPFARDHAI